MNLRKGTVLLLSCFLLTQSYKADAQFWKRWFHKEEPVRKKPVPKKTVANDPPPPPPKPRKRLEVDYPQTEKKNRYRIDVFASLYLDELVRDGKPVFKGRVPDKAQAGVEFYEGVMLATDTLNKLGFTLDVYVHDITDPHETAEALIQNRSLDASDLIIGAVQSAQIPVLAQFARKHEINFISALSPSDGSVTRNPYFTLLQPTLQTHCGSVMARVLKKYKKQRVVVYKRNSVPQDDNAYNFLMEEDEDNRGDFVKISCNKMPEREKLQSVFSSTSTNVIMMPILDVAYAESLIKQLHDYFPNYAFDVYGMPSWKSMSSLKKADAYPNVAVNITVPFYYDPTTVNGRYLNDAYRKAYGPRMGEMVYRGYETVFWYSYLLRRYGNIFNPYMKDNDMAPFTRFDIRHEWDTDKELLYNENEHLFWYRYQSASMMIDQ